MIEDGKKELTYFKKVDTGRLIQELYDMIPELKPILLNNGKYKINLRVFTNENKLTLWVLENIDDYLVNNVVTNHQIITIEGENNAL